MSASLKRFASWRPCADSIFGCLSEAQCSALCNSQVWHTYEQARPLFYEGTPALAVFHIREGEVRLCRSGHAGEQLVVGIRRAGDLLGVRAVMAGDVYTVTAEPGDRVTAGTIPREVLLGFVHENHAFACRLLENMAVRTRATEEWIISRVLDSAIKRTARVLLGLPHSRSRKREDQAALIGTSPETLSRILHQLRERGVIELLSHDIRIKNLESLRQLAE